MKVKQSKKPGAIYPVSLVFETQEELLKFVDKVGNHNSADVGLPFRFWNELDDIASGYPQI